MITTRMYGSTNATNIVTPSRDTGGGNSDSDNPTITGTDDTAASAASTA
jgi:hypothetical protein